MNIFKNDFEQQWEYLFNDVTKLNRSLLSHSLINKEKGLEPPRVTMNSPKSH